MVAPVLPPSVPTGVLLFPEVPPVEVVEVPPVEVVVVPPLRVVEEGAYDPPELIKLPPIFVCVGFV
jgi:hypothetical protein